MKKVLLLAVAVAALSLAPRASAQYYKDVFVDAGIHLSDYDDFPVARLLGLSWERFTAGEYPDHLTLRDTVTQRALYEGSPIDENGGSYIGSCAGAFLVSMGGTDFDKEKGRCRDDQVNFVNDKYLHLFPGRTLETRLSNSYADLVLEKNSPLLKYSDFGGSRRIPQVRHSNGCCIVEKDPHFPKGTRPLLRFDFAGDTAAGRPYPLTGKIAIWSFRDNDTSGLVIATGSHPESNPQGMIAKGPSLNLFSALVQYALDETGPARIKGALRKGDFAWAREARYADCSLGCSKTMTFETLPAGTWYVGVHCATTVDTEPTDKGCIYTGHVETLNGVPYTLTITWE